MNAFTFLSYTVGTQTAPISTITVQLYPDRYGDGTPVTDPKNPPGSTGTGSGICYSGNSWTKNLHIKASSINPGIQLYLNDGVTLATPGNLSSLDANTGVAGFNLYGIKWLREVNKATIYTVNPTTGVVDGIHTSSCP